MSSLIALLALAIQVGDSALVSVESVRGIAFSAQGRLVFEVSGDLWIADLSGDMTSPAAFANAAMTRVTSGPAWDHEPAWTPDGQALVFASDRSGTLDIWRANADGSGTPERLTKSPDAEGQPAVGADGTIAFVRGRSSTSNIWLLTGDGLRQFTDDAGAERFPSFSPDGDRLVYLHVDRGARSTQLLVKSIEDGPSRVVLTGVTAEHPVWSPQGDRLAYATRGGNAGVWVTPLDGSYSNLVSARAAEPAWTPDGGSLALAELPRPSPGYNGDPDRVGDRGASDIFARGGKMWVAGVPAPPDADLSEVALAPVTGGSDRNAEAFDRAWSRLENLYYQDRNHEEWVALGERFRPMAVDATSTLELDDVIYEMLQARPPFRPEATGRAAVSSAHPLATAAGVEVLEAGGNVIDAAVAVSFALGVVEPDASGMAGYGEMVVYMQDMAEPVVIEFLTRVPEQASLSAFGGSLPPDGPVLANVPGTVAGMWKAWEQYGSGRVEWAQLLAPAIRLAADGFVLDDALPTTLHLERQRFLKYPGSAKLFFRDGEPLQRGDTFQNPDLAWTLRQVAEGGAEAFYEGEVAKRLVEDLRGQGSPMTLEDMARYFAVERTPIQGTYRGHTVYSSVPAASGGTSLVSKLHLLDQYDDARRYTDHAGTAHAMIEAWKLQPSTSGRIADPGLWPVDVGPVVDRDSARIRWERCFDPERSTGPEELAGSQNTGPRCAQEVASSLGEDGSSCVADLDDTTCRATGTTAFAIGDADGNIVAVTQTLGTWGGNFYVTPGLGFLYNDKLRSYSTNPSSYNARLPYARNGTSIAPTLVFRGTGDAQQPMAAVSAAGNAWITAAVYQVVASMVDGNLGPQEALEMPRFLVGVRREPGASGEVREIVVQIEDGFSPQVMRQLRRMGHEFQPISLRGELRMGYGAAVLVGDGRVRAGADPRRSGAAGAVR